MGTKQIENIYSEIEKEYKERESKRKSNNKDKMNV